MPDEDGPLGEELLVLAEAQMAEGHFGVAVVIAQKVIEASVEFDDITVPGEEWKAYHQPIERRNKVAHGRVIFGWDPDDDITEEQAKASVQAVRAMRDHIDRVVAQQVGELGGPKQDQWRALRAISPRPDE